MTYEWNILDSSLLLWSINIILVLYFIMFHWVLDCIQYNIKLLPQA